MRNVNCFKLVICILLVSLGMNIYLSVNKGTYKEKALKDTYSDLRKIKEKSKSSEEIISLILEKGKYEGIEILYVYKELEVIASSVTKLWADYSFFEEKPIIQEKKITTNNNVKGDVFYRIEEYMKNITGKVILDNKKEYKLNEKEREDMKKIKSFLKEIKNIFTFYDENELKGFDEESREKEVMKKEYWIDILKKINELSFKYSDYDFSNEYIEQSNI